MTLLLLQLLLAPSTILQSGVAAPKIALAPASALDERGVVASAAVAPMEVVASIPRALVLSTPAGAGWAARLTEAALRAPPGALRDGVWAWRYAGWSTATEERIDAAERERFTRDWRSAAGLLTTGSDNDVEIYRKFGLPTHPAIDRAAQWLGLLTSTSTPTARWALESRGFAYRACRDRLRPLVDLGSLPPPDAAADLELGGSLRERRDRATAAIFSRAAARATLLDDGDSVAVVPLHERLAHCGGEDGGNVRLVAGDPRDAAGGDADAVLLVATRAIAAGEPLTRDFTRVPRIESRPPYTATPTAYKPPPPGEDDTAMLLLLQTGVE